MALTPKILFEVQSNDTNLKKVHILLVCLGTLIFDLKSTVNTLQPITGYVVTLLNWTPVFVVQMNT